MKLKDALIRAARSAGQAFVVATGFVELAPFQAVADIKRTALGYAFAAAFAVATFVVVFVQNLAEDNTKLSLGPKG